jgi:hypothetical protein
MLGMESLVALVYPNGRTHETTVTVVRELEPGAGFDLYGHHWKAVGLIRSSRSTRHLPGRMQCVSAPGSIAPVKA